MHSGYLIVTFVLSVVLCHFFCVSDQLMRLNGSWSSVCGRVYHFVSNISANNYEILAFFPTPNAQQFYFCNTTCTVNKMRYGLQNMIIKNKQQILGKVITYYCTAINNPICKTRLIGMQCVRIINVLKKINTQLAKLPETNNTVGQIPKVNTKRLCIYLLSFCLTEASCLQGFKVNTICTCQSIHTLRMYHCRVKQI